MTNIHFNATLISHQVEMSCSSAINNFIDQWINPVNNNKTGLHNMTNYRYWILDSYWLD